MPKSFSTSWASRPILPSTSCATIDSIYFSNDTDSPALAAPFPRLPEADWLKAAAYLVEIVNDVSFFILVSHSAFTLSHLGASIPRSLQISSWEVPDVIFAFAAAQSSNVTPSTGSKIELIVLFGLVYDLLVKKFRYYFPRRSGFENSIRLRAKRE